MPSILAGLITFPLMTALFDVVGIFGGYLVGVKLLGLSSGHLLRRDADLRRHGRHHDRASGSRCPSGIIVTWVCTYKGFHVGHGAEGVARATTQAVVLSSVLILVLGLLPGSVLP